MTTPTPKPNDPVVAGDVPADSKEQIQREIDVTREQLGDTVEALAHKVNVPARAKDSVREAVSTVQEKAGELGDNASGLANRAVTALPPQARGRVEQFVATVRQRPLPFALGAVGAFLVTVWLLRRNR
jgi:hypothetical protein